ncbi:MAG: HNH endonuclease [Bacteroidia bacterium]|nr:HNH endonuclease [Bacteroidia bacterium]
MINMPKSWPAPACLETEQKKPNGHYDCGEVLERLVKDCFNKCYLCEQAAPASLEIEHARPHRGDPALKFGWDNLLLACPHCNRIKNQGHQPMINCGTESRRITDLIEVRLEPFPQERMRAVPASPDPDEAVVQTCRLLEAVFNGTTPHSRMECNNLQKHLLRELGEFQQLLRAYASLGSPPPEDLAAHLHPESAFTAFKIQILKDWPHRPAAWDALLKLVPLPPDAQQ